MSFWPWGIWNRENLSLASNWSDFSNTVVSNESLYVDFFFPPSHPLSVAMATGVEGLVKKKKKKKILNILPTFTDKFLDPFAPYFFIFILQSKCFSFFLFFFLSTLLHFSGSFPVLFKITRLVWRAVLRLQGAGTVPALVPGEFHFSETRHILILLYELTHTLKL